MVNAYDIFRLEAGSSVRWLESVSSLDRANERIRQLAAVEPGNYIIFNQISGSKMVWHSLIQPHPRETSAQAPSVEDR